MSLRAQRHRESGAKFGRCHKSGARFESLFLLSKKKQKTAWAWRIWRQILEPNDKGKSREVCVHCPAAWSKTKTERAEKNGVRHRKKKRKQEGQGGAAACIGKKKKRGYYPSGAIKTNEEHDFLVGKEEVAWRPFCTFFRHEIE